MQLRTRENAASKVQDESWRRPTHRCGQDQGVAPQQVGFPTCWEPTSRMRSGPRSHGGRLSYIASAQVIAKCSPTLLHHHHHRTRHRPCQHSLLLSNLHVTATMSRPYDLSKVDLKPKRHHGYSVLIFIFGTLFPPLGPSSSISTSLHRSTQWLMRPFSHL